MHNCRLFDYFCQDLRENFKKPHHAVQARAEYACQQAKIHGGQGSNLMHAFRLWENIFE